MEFSLFVRLEKVLIKYEEQIVEKAILYHRIIEKSREPTMENSGIEVGEMKESELKEPAKQSNFYKVAKCEGINIGESFFKVTMKHLFKWPDRRKNLLIRY